jgi:hypothetical protein
MKKRMFRSIAVVIIVTAIISAFALTAFAIGIDFTASLSVNRRKNMVGDEVQFTVHIVNTGSWDLEEIHISNTRGGVIAEYNETVEDGESVDIPVIKVFNAAGEFGVKFKVFAGAYGDYKTIETNTVTVTINAPPTPSPEPSPEPTPEPTVEPTPEPTLEPTLEPSPELIAIAVDEDADDEQPQKTSEQAGEKSAQSEQKGSSNTVLYIILGVVGAMLLAAVAVIIVLKRKMKTGKKN